MRLIRYNIHRCTKGMAEMVQAVLKTDILYERLLEELGKYSPGDQFMTNREIMKRFNVSQLVVDQTVGRFRDAGLLRVVPGRGTFTTEAIRRFRSDAPATYLFAVPRWNSTDLTLMEECIQELRRKFAPARILIHRFDYTEQVPLELPLKEENVKGIALLASSSASWDSSTLARLERYAAEVPLVIMNRHHGDIPLPAVGADDVFAGNIAADHLFHHGHRKIALLISEPHNSVICERVRGVLNGAKLRGMECRVLDCGVRSGEYAPDKTYRFFTGVIRDGIDFTGLIGLSSDSFAGAVNACLNCGVKIPEALSLVTIGLRRMAEIQHPPLDCVDLNMEGQLEGILEILTRPDAFSPEENPYEYTVPSLVVNGSVAKRT